MPTVDYSAAARSVHIHLAAGSATTVTAPSGYITSQPSMLAGENGFEATALLTVGTSLSSSGALNPQSAGTYTPPTAFDGLGATLLNATTVRVFVNHEIGATSGSAYQVGTISGGPLTLTGARIDYFDLDRTTMAIKDAGLAYGVIHDRSGAIVTSGAQLDQPAGLSSFCSSALFEPNAFGAGRGTVEQLYFTGQENGGTPYVLDTVHGELWAVPAFGQGAYENAAQLDTGDSQHVAFLLDSDRTGSPMYLYVGTKNASGDFLDRNGLKNGQLFYWVSDTGETLPSQFTSGTRAGHWQAITVRDVAQAGQPGYDSLGYKLTTTLSSEALAGGAFSFARPEDASTNPANGAQAVFAATGGMAGDTVGTIYKMNFSFASFSAPTAALTILYDGDADPGQALRNPDNLDWADDGYIYAQEDRANISLFGAGAANPNEASIVRIDPVTGAVTRVAEMNRGAVPAGFVDSVAPVVGAWESSGILDVSSLFGQAGGKVFLSTVQAHGVTTGPLTPGAIARDSQLVVLTSPGTTFGPAAQVDPLVGVDGAIGSAFADTIVGDAAANSLSGGGGADTIYGGAGNDLIAGDAANDLLAGEAGNDVMTGGAGTDQIIGGAGLDKSTYADASGSATWRYSASGAWTVTTPGGGTDAVSQVEMLQFSDRPVRLYRLEGEELAGDFNNDGREDVLLRAADGQVQTWETAANGAVQTSRFHGVQSFDHFIAGVGDFNGVGGDDILWRNQTTGTLSFWSMNGTATPTGAIALPLEWHIHAVADFNGDNTDDLLLRNANTDALLVWQVGSFGVTGGAPVGVVTGSWRLLGTGDFNGDSKDDLLWYNSANNALSTWQMDGGTQIGGGVLGVLDATWSVQGIADFNADGRDDILWRHTSGALSQWQMNGATVTASAVFASAPATSIVQNVGTYDSGSTADILWRDAASGAVSLWTMNGMTVAGTQTIALPSQDWWVL